jgi:tetratricopeptide (TPR) repeat protein
MACTLERRAEIAELAGGRLGAAEAAGLLEHVQDCGACSAELDLVADLLHASPSSAAVEPVRFRRRWIGGLVALAAAAACLFVFLRAPPERRLRDLARLAPPPSAGLVLRGGADDTAGFEQAAGHLAAGDAARAADAFRALLAARPDDPLVLFYLGVARLQQGEIEEAIEALRRAEELGTELLAEQALWYRAQAHLARDDGTGAAALLRRLVELDGDYEPNARAQLAELEPLLGR